MPQLRECLISAGEQVPPAESERLELPKLMLRSSCTLRVSVAQPMGAKGENTVGEPSGRTKHISGSPRHKSLKKMHFIKNMRQYDTKNSRIVLICAKRTLCVAFSILPYGESLRISDLKMEGQKQRHPSGGVSVSTEMVLGLEGVELGADGKVVSYAKFLYPTNALVVRKADSHSAVPSCRANASRSLPGSRYKPVTAKTIPAGTDIVVESDEVSPQPPSLQAEQPQVPQPLPISLVLQTLPQLRCPSLDTLQPLNVSLGVRGPTLNTAFEVRPHQCPVQGHDHCPSPAGHTVFDTSQDAIGFLGHLGTRLAHIQLSVNQHPQVLFRLAAFQPLFPKPVALHGVVVTQVQDLPLGLVKPHTIGLGPSIQPVQVPLQSLPPLQQINTPAQLGVICKLTEGALDPFVQIIDKDVKQDWPQHRALGNTTCDRPPTGLNSIHHHSLGPDIQPVLYPAKRSEAGEATEYDPNLLDDPQWPCGKHKRVLIFASYMTTVIEYVKPSDLKKDMNETFREKFPHIKLTLSKIRSLKREMRNLSEECNLEPVTVSMAYVYFEKLVLQGKLNKQNRKLCAGACVLLAAKISSDLRKHEVKHLIDKLEERFRFNRRDLIGFEFTVLVALELALYLPENQVLPHYRRLTQQS
ncbi:hypothetical protein QYF61_011497 [Mycteria americana]|uniref:Cyclin N-terminal domain-containing protein n=1 Tax=Mycteria americana TaxID=33587 RepID=A0AAN7RXS4_MYCAM|nr:hypothetical protein QYF61_011497 [Mycteria americana]